ncbi:MAG: nuclear transport factor 2 family protein [Ilumatobacteraceae bacterium]
MSGSELLPDADEAAIIRLTHDYCWALDSGDYEALRQVFTPDCTARLGGNQSNVDEVIARVSAALGPLDDSQHMVSTHQIRRWVDGTVTGRCYLHAQHIRTGVAGGDQYIVAGRYEDRYVRTDEGWRIAERELVVMWTAGNRDVVRRG